MRKSVWNRGAACWISERESFGAVVLRRLGDPGFEIGSFHVLLSLLREFLFPRVISTECGVFSEGFRCVCVKEV